MGLAYQNILLWRHADAELAQLVLRAEDDMTRALTPKGKHQAKIMARWLKSHQPKHTQVLASPALRALETAEALHSNIAVLEALKPGASLQAVLQTLENLEAPKENLLIVGHQPWLGALAAHLTGCGEENIHIKKGAIWWLRLASKNSTSTQARYNIYTVQTPALMD